MTTYEQIKKANEEIRMLPVKGKDYAEVAQRVTAFRKVYPDGFIISNMTSNENGLCIFCATCGFYDQDGQRIILGTGTAYEKESSSYINKTSYIENCETSAVGRALGFAGFGIATSIASADEVTNAIRQQEPQFTPATPKGEAPAEPTPAPPAKHKKLEGFATPDQLHILSGVYEGENLVKLLKARDLGSLDDMTAEDAFQLIEKLKKAGKVA